MQSALSSSVASVRPTLTRRVSAPSVARPSSRTVVCQAAQHKQAAKVAAAAASLPALLATHPALALVDDRLNGDGTGKILGIGSVEGWAILIVFALVWSLYYAAQTDLDKGKNSSDDSGLSL